MKTLILFMFVSTLTYSQGVNDPVPLPPNPVVIADSVYVAPEMPQTGNLIIDKLAPILLPLLLTFLAGLKGKVNISDKMKSLGAITVGTFLIILSGFVHTGWFMVILCFTGAVGGIFGINNIRQFYWNFSGALKSKTVLGYSAFLGVTVLSTVLHSLDINVPVINTIMMIIQLLGGATGLYGIFNAALGSHPDVTTSPAK